MNSCTMTFEDGRHRRPPYVEGGPDRGAEVSPQQQELCSRVQTYCYGHLYCWIGRMGASGLSQRQQGLGLELGPCVSRYDNMAGTSICIF